VACSAPNGVCWEPTSNSPRTQDTIVDWVFGELNPPGAYQPMFGWIPYRDLQAVSCP